MHRQPTIENESASDVPLRERCYPLSPLQQGMLFHHLLAPGAGVDIEQMVCTLREPIDVPALRAAWEQVVGRHAILRTAFRWEGLAQPQQEVRSTVSLPFVQEDWRSFSNPQRAASLQAFLKTDRAAGFAMDEAPMMRLALFQCGAEHFELVWTFHHALLDGRSFPIVLKEVFAFYEAATRGEALALPLPRPYSEYIEWLRALELAPAEKFWRQLLSGFTSATPLVVDHPALELEGESRQGDQKTFLPAPTTARLETLAKENGFTLNTFIQGAWALLLHRYSGETDVVFGATRACRRSAVAGAEAMVGLFINTLPVRARIHPETPLLDWLRELRAQWTAMRAFEHTPLAQVQNWSAIGGGKPLFESILVFENYLLNTTLRAQGGGWANREVRLYEQTNFPITVTVYGGAELCLQLEFDRSRFDDATILQMLGHFRTLLEAMAEHPRQRLMDLPLLTAAEHEEIVRSWNATARDYPKGVRLHQLFEAQAARTPEAVALVFEQTQLSYRELDRRANQLAHHLRSLGVQPDQLVGVCCERSIEMVVALYGIVKAGGAYVPIDPEYPADRVAFMIADAGVPVLLTQKHLIGQLPSHSARVVCLDSDWPEISRARDAKPHDEISAANLAYMIYTSGSTGKPKGAMNEHRGICNRLLWMQEQYQIGPADVVLQKTPFSFDVSVWEFFWPLQTGARLVIAKPGGHKDAAYLTQLIREQGVTTLHFVPPMLRVFLDEPGVEACRSLRHVVCSGEALPFDLQEKCFAKLGAQLHNLYGPTEAAVDVTHWTCRREGELKIVPIGRPVANTQCYVLDAALRPLPIGVPGELHLGGVQIGRGYHNRPELTAEKFIPDPFRADAAARLYKTGDLCRYLPDGNIEYLGRLDHQVKIRGFRIELGEIEARLAEHGAVKDNVVVARQDGGEKRLVAYLVAQQQPAPGVAELREHLLKSLPDFMVPSAFVWMEALPLSPNGKVDRKVLPAPERAQANASRYVAPRNANEQALAEAWAAVLRLERVGIEDNFFELGGDSILMIQIIARTRSSGLALTPKLIFKHPTIAELAAAVPPAKVAAAEQGLVVGEAALTPVQQWFFELNPAEPHHWNQAFLFQTRERLDAALLAKAVDHLERHHDALRLRFQQTGAGWAQSFAAPGAGSFEAVKGNIGMTDICARAQASLRLEAGPLFRVLYLEAGTEPAGRLLIVVHHLAVDGISWRILLEDLETAYGQLRAGRAVQLPAKTASFQRWSQALAEHARHDAWQSELCFWRAVPASSLPADVAGAEANTEGAAKLVAVSLEADETRDLLQRVPAAFNSQINDALLTALAQAFARWSGRSGTTLDLEGHGREDIADGLDVSRTVGWFTTVFPVHLDVAPDAAPAAALKRVKEQLRAVPRRGIGYGLLRYLGGAAELKVQPQAEVIFNYFGQFDQVLGDAKLFQFAPESSGPWRSAGARRRYLLEINALVTGGRLEVRWTFAPSKHRAATVQRVAEDFVAALRQLIQASALPGASALTPSDFPLAKLDQAALDQLIASHGKSEDIFPLSPVQRLFHALESSGNSVGFDQYHYKLRGSLDAAALRVAWQKVLARHAILRTAFVAEGLKEPLQVVRPVVALPWIEEDWRNVAAVERETKFFEYLKADRARGFDLTKPPLMRCSLLRVDVAEWWFVWSHHHLQVDGWSWPLIFKEVAGEYAGARAGAAPRSFGDYVAWSGERCGVDDEKFWRATLHGFKEPTPLPQKEKPTATGGFAEETLVLPTIETEALRQLARGGQMTLNTLAQAAWAAVLSRQSGRDDVVFGAAFSGRPAELAGVEKMVGSFVNNLPVRVRVPVEKTASDWLQDLQTGQVQLSQHQFTSPMQVQEWSEVPWRFRLFESLVVFQNYVVDEAAWRLGDIAIQDFVAPIRTNFPLTLVVVPGRELTLTLVYDARKVDANLARQLLRDVTTALRGLAANPKQPVGGLLASLSAPGPRPVGGSEKLRGSSQNYLAPQTDLEKSIANIWQQAFGIERVGTADNFFDLGGHSLLMLQVHARLVASLGRDISIVRMFQYPTVGSLAKFLGQAPGEQGFEMIQNRAQLQRAALARQRTAIKRTT